MELLDHIPQDEKYIGSRILECDALTLLWIIIHEINQNKIKCEANEEQGSIKNCSFNFQLI